MLQIVVSFLLATTTHQDANSIREIVKDLQSLDAGARQSAIQRLGNLDDKQKRRAGSAIRSLAGKLCKELDRAVRDHRRKILSSRPDPATLKRMRDKIMELGRSLPNPSSSYESIRRELKDKIRALWKLYYPDVTKATDSPEVKAVLERLASVERAAEVVGSKGAVKMIRDKRASMGQDRNWEIWLSPRDCGIMRENEAKFKRSSGALKMDPEEHTFSVLVNLYRVMMGFKAVPLDLKLSQACRKYSLHLQKTGKFEHSGYMAECLATGRDGAGAFWILFGDWPHHSAYFECRRIGIGRGGSIWTFRW
jgi:hypothetical protein